MEILAIMVALASVAGFLFGLVNLVKPLGWLKITRRRHGLYLVVGSFFVFIFASLVGAASQPGGLSAASEGAAGPAERASPKEAAAKPAGLTQAEYDQLWTQTSQIMEGCDLPMRAAGEALGTGDPYAAFGPVTRARRACEAAWLEMSDLRLPRSARGDVKKAAEKAVDECEMALFLKREAMGQVAKVLDGDTRPSAVQKAQEDMESATASTYMCVAAYAGLASTAGLEFAADTEG